MRKTYCYKYYSYVSYVATSLCVVYMYVRIDASCLRVDMSFFFVYDWNQSLIYYTYTSTSYSVFTILKLWYTQMVAL